MAQARKKLSRSVLIVTLATCLSIVTYFSYTSRSKFSNEKIFDFQDDLHKKKNITSQQNISSSIQYIISQRTTLPKKCINSTQNTLHINPIDHNWAPYFHRCKYKLNQYQINGFQKYIGEVFISKELMYQHIYKSGGTTIQKGLER